MGNSPEKDYTLKADQYYEEMPSELMQSVRQRDLDLSRVIRMLYEDIEGQISRVDQKAHIILTANAILSAFMTGVIQLPDHTISDGFLIIIFALILISVYFALATSFPRLTFSASAHRHNENVFYFGDVIKMSADAYLDEFKTMTMQDVKDSVILQIHSKSRVLSRKYLFVQRGSLSLFASIFISIFVVTLAFVN